MIQVVEAAGILAVHLLLFYVFGFIVEKMFNVHRKRGDAYYRFESVAELIIMGMFAYFSLFQIFCVPMAYIGVRFVVLCVVWPFVVLVCCGIAANTCRNSMDRTAKEFREMVKARNGKVLLCIAAIIVAMLTAYAVLRTVNGWDAFYYISVANEAITTDYFYNFEGNTGIFVENIVDKTALSSFYLQFAFWCKLTGVTPRIMFYYCTRGLCVILSALVVFLIAKEIFGTNRKKQYLTVIVWAVLSTFATANHSAAFFMLLRGYEAKGWLANIILPMTFLGLFRLYKAKSDEEVKKAFAKLFVIGFASVPISMSALAIFPVAIAVGTLSVMIANRAIKKYIFKAAVVVAPNVFYLVLYYGKRVGALLSVAKSTVNETAASTPGEVAETTTAGFEGVIREGIKYLGSYIWIGLFVVAIIYLLVRMNKSQKKYAIITAVVALVCVFNNFAARIIGLFYTIGTFYRFFWAIPVIVIIAVAIVDVICSEKEVVRTPIRIMVPVFVSVLLVITGTNFFKDYNDKPQNSYLMLWDTQQVADVISSDKETGARPVIALPRALDYVYRTVDCENTMAIGRFGWTYLEGNPTTMVDETMGPYLEIIAGVINDGEIVEPAVLKEALDYQKVDYVVCLQKAEVQDCVREAGYEFLGLTQNFAVFKKSLPKDDAGLSIDEITIDLLGVDVDDTLMVVNDMHIITVDETVSADNLATVEDRMNWAVSADGVPSADLWMTVSKNADNVGADQILMLGDMIDYGAKSNLDVLSAGFDEISTPFTYLRADHDVGEWYTNGAYSREDCIKLSKEVAEWKDMYSIDMGEYIILGWNNSTTWISRDGLQVAREAFEARKPIILVTHVPIDSTINDDVYNAALATDDQGRAKIWSDRGLYTPTDETTRVFLDMVVGSDSPVQAIICGHLHTKNTSKITNHITQYILDASFKGRYAVINVK